jgi:hypothetical protein
MNSVWTGRPDAVEQKESLDHLIGAEHEPSRNFMSNGFCSSKIDNQLELSRLLDRHGKQRTKAINVSRLLRAPKAAMRAPRRPRATRTRAASFDHLVGAGDQRWRHLQPERLGSLEVDDQLELVRLLHRQVCGLGALQYLVHV